MLLCYLWYLFSNNVKFDGEYLNDKELTGTRYSLKGNILDKVNNINGKGKEYNINNILP